MSFVERRKNFRPETGAAPFELDETFFSRTDDRGVIKAANFIFHRVADYDWSELIGAPHRIIRHPDMPAGVFWLLWDTIKRGEPIGAYVKNRAKDGLYYWVFAVVMPVTGGYLSVRIKPSSDMFATVQQEYKTLRMAELSEGVKPEESAQALMARIKELGFSDYCAFGSEALVQELSARDAGLGAPPDGDIALFNEMIVAADNLQKETAALSQGFGSISTIPTNMRVIAARLEPSGGALSALSQNYWSMSEEMSAWFRHFVAASDSDFSGMRTALDGCRFLHCTARILSESSRQFRGERRALGKTDVAREKDVMSDLAAQYRAKSTDRLRQVTQEALRISNAVTVMRRYTLGLNSTRVMCNIERARLTTGKEGLTSIITQLDGFQVSIEKQLSCIDQLSSTIQNCAATLEMGHR